MHPIMFIACQTAVHYHTVCASNSPTQQLE